MHVHGARRRHRLVAPHGVEQLVARDDYRAWTALGVGGVPHTLEGYRTVKALGARMRDPLDTARVAGDIGRPGDVAVLKALPRRGGPTPQIAPFAVPHGRTVARLVPAGHDDQRPWLRVRGTLRKYDDPFAPAVEERDIDAIA